MQLLVDEIEDFARKNPDKIDVIRIADQMKSVLDGTLVEMEQGRFAKPIDKTHIIGFDGQIKGARGELAEARVAPSMTKFNQIIDGVEFDQVRPDGSLFQTKSLSAARGPSAKQPLGNNTYQSAMEQVRATLEVAERHPNPATGQPADVTIRFPRRVDQGGCRGPEGDRRERTQGDDRCCRNRPASDLTRYRDAVSDDRLGILSPSSNRDDLAILVRRAGMTDVREFDETAPDQPRLLRSRSPRSGRDVGRFQETWAIVDEVDGLRVLQLYSPATRYTTRRAQRGIAPSQARMTLRTATTGRCRGTSARSVTPASAWRRARRFSIPANTSRTRRGWPAKAAGIWSWSWRPWLSPAKPTRSRACTSVCSTSMPR